MPFLDLHEMLIKTADVVRPPERMTVAEAAAEYRYVYSPGAFVGKWQNDMTPYMIEPQEVLTSTDFTAMVFVGPARCGKSDLFFNWLLHTQVCDPADMMRVDMTQATSRDWSQGDLARFLRHNEIVRDKLLPGRHHQNVHDIHFESGTRLLVKWPTVTEFSGKTIPRLWLADYDRMPQDMEGEGPPFDLARRRAATFRRYGMTVAESSPGFVVTDPKHIPSDKHEAPVTSGEGNPGGILPLFNRGDRRRFYWKCADCGLPYEPSFSLLTWPDTTDIAEAAELAKLECPHCGYQIAHDPNEKYGVPGKYQMNLGGRWIKSGQIWTRDGEIKGTALRSDTASFWLKGPPAGLTDWQALVSDYLKAKKEYDENMSEESLKSFFGLGAGEPYVPRLAQSNRVPEELRSRHKQIPLGQVPLDTRFLIATIDVQQGRFVVQVMGAVPNGDINIVDRFDIRKSKRLDKDGERYPVSPGAHPEDWHLLVEQVIEKEYPLIDGSGRVMKIRMCLCDSGGEKGVAVQALNFWRWLRDGPAKDAKSDEGWTPGLHNRLYLVRGTGNMGAPSIKLDYPDAGRKDRHSGARGDVPVITINTNKLKDWLDKILERVEPGGRINFPDDLNDAFYSELCVEVRDEKGRWENIRRQRNESWDLLVYYLAATLTARIGLEHIDWAEPPTWAAPWDANELVSTPEGFAAKKTAMDDPGAELDRLAKMLA